VSADVQLGTVQALALVATLCGCDVSLDAAPISANGVFRGTTPDGQVMEITAIETPQGFAGHGKLHETAVSLSFLVSPQSVGLVNASGNISPSRAELALDEDALTLQLIDGSVRLVKTASAPTIPATFSGRFTSGGTGDFSGQIDFVQYGNLASGTGQVLGQTFALSGTVDTSGRFTGRAIFVDESEATISGKLSEQNRVLSVLGFGSPLQFKR
jgi:hypothetical protein